MRLHLRLLKPLIAAIVAVVTVLGFASSAHGGVVFNGRVTEVDGRDSDHVQFPKAEAAVVFRPLAPHQKSLTLQNYFIHDLTNQKGLDIRATRHDNGMPAWAFSSITLRNLKIHDVERREDLPGGNGLHIDHIRIAGGVTQDVKTDILIENLEIDGGDALPILITDGVYGTITLRNVTIKDTTLNSVQLKTDKVGSIDRIVIENSPGIGVALIGRPGSIGEVVVKNSPNVRLGDTLNSSGKTGAVVNYLAWFGSDSDCGQEPLTVKPAVPNGETLPGTIRPPATAPIPEPGMLAPLALAVLALKSRRRR